MLVNALYNIVDQLFIGHVLEYLGSAATNVAFPLSTISTSIALLLGIGGASNFSLKLGQGKTSDAGAIASNSISLLTIAGIAAGAVVLIFLNPILYAFGATELIYDYAFTYTLIIACGMPFLIFTTGACHLIRADGSPGYAMFCLLSGAVFNVIFDYVFLIVMDMGIAGIALATALGQILTASIAAYYIIRKFKSVKLLKKDFIPKFKYIKSITSLGVAAFFNQVAMAAVQIVQNNTMSHYGAISIYGSEIPLACIAVISKLNIVFMSFTIGIAQGCQPIYGFNFGAENYGRVKKTLITAITSATFFAVIFFLLFQIFPRDIISWFGPGSEIYFVFAVKYLRIFMFFTFLNGFQPIASNFFTSISKAKMGVFMSATRHLIFLIPLILILPIYFGIDGTIFAGPIADFAAFSLAAIFLIRGIRRLKIPV
jgi:Na+-driven multidrug efflux pump